MQTQTLDRVVKPPIRLHDLRRHLKRQAAQAEVTASLEQPTTIAGELQKLWEHNMRLFPTAERKIQMRRAGAFYKANYEGRAVCVFATDLREARSRLKLFDPN
jgi:hypothetical protein